MVGISALKSAHVLTMTVRWHEVHPRGKNHHHLFPQIFTGVTDQFGELQNYLPCACCALTCDVTL